MNCKIVATLRRMLANWRADRQRIAARRRMNARRRHAGLDNIAMLSPTDIRQLAVDHDRVLAESHDDMLDEMDKAELAVNGGRRVLPKVYPINRGRVLRGAKN